MHKLYTFAGILAGIFILYSFSTNPPNANTGAPGEDLCVQCHVGNTSMGGTLTLEGFPDNINPNQTYTLTIINRDTVGTAVRGGFQMTILGPTNTKAGDLTSPSAKSIVSVQGGRQYWEHNPAVEYPDSNVVKWTVQWKAHEMPSGSEVKWYAAGNIANGNFQNTGDRVVTATGRGTIILAGTENITLPQLALFPNPGSDHINIVFKDQESLDGTVIFYDINGHLVNTEVMDGGIVNTSQYQPGVYLLHVLSQDRSFFIKWSKM